MVNKIITLAVCILFGSLLVACITEVDDTLPYDQLPEITVATEVMLVASPSQPTSELPFEPVPAGATIQLLGTDQDAAWLLVLHNDKIGWMPTVFARTNVATLPSAVVFDPLASDCTKYIDTTADPAQEWTNTTEGSLLVLGSLYRPQHATEFTAASLSIAIEGGGTVVDSDYLHTPLTPTSAIVFFAYAVNDLQKGDLFRFQVENPSNEPLAFQAAYFSDSCQSDLKKLPIGIVKTISPASTTPQTEAVQQAAPTEESPVIVYGTYIWSVKAANIDDAAAILVNGEMVAGGSFSNGPGQTGWVDITDHIIPGQETAVTLISLNGFSIGGWGFFVRRGETIIWGQEGEDPREHTMQYAKTVIINTDREITEAETTTAPTSTLPGEWLMHVQDMDDIGIILVNGQPVGGAVLCSTCPPTTIDIGPWLDANQENTISMASWNVIDSPFSYRFVLEHDGAPIWQQDKSGTANAGLTFSDLITITTEGELQLASAQQPDATAGEQEAVNPVVADNECNVLPTERCIPAETGFDGWSVGVLDQITSGDSWATFSVGDPTILFYENEFHLWFVGLSGQGSNYAIGYATSKDGIDWTVESSPVLLAGDPGSWESRGVASPSVIIKDDQFEMFYLGIHDNWQTDIGSATSVDGIHWKKNANNPVLVANPREKWMSNSVRDPSVLYNGQIYQMWFSAAADINWQGGWQLGYAESADGHNWTIVANQPVISLGSGSSWKSRDVLAPDVLLIANTYHMWYSGRTNPQTSDWRIGHATSLDGVNWTEDLNNPIFGLGPSDGFASGRVAHPTLVLSSEGYHLWYAGSRLEDQNTWKIGLATSKDGVRWLR